MCVCVQSRDVQSHSRTLKAVVTKPEGGQLLPGSVIRHYRRGHLVLPGVLPGVTWVLPGRYLGVTWVFILESFFFGGPKISAFLKLKLLEKNQFP